MKFTFSIFVMLFFSSLTFSQADTSVELDSVQTNRENTVFYFSTNESFIAGNNAYVMHIGGKPFHLSEHPNGNLSLLNFNISKDEFMALKKDAEIVLVYGFYHSNTQQDGEGTLTNGYVGMHWKFGQVQNLKNK